LEVVRGTSAVGSGSRVRKREQGMKIKWYGHACFRIENDGIAIITDPYTPDVAGLDPVDEPSDVVVISSATDRFHSYASMVPGDPKVLNAQEIARRSPSRRTA
jgi:L-ascorbate metabolism protein UlaG (beta-lactamase superfamily)